MLRVNRREFLGSTACGTFGAAALAGLAPGWWMRRELAGAKGELAELVRWVRAVDSERMVPELVDRIATGLTPDCLLLALLYAGIADVTPRPVGFQFHCVLQLPAVRAVVQASSPRDQWRALAYAVANYRQLAARFGAGGGLPAPPATNLLPSAERAAAQLAAACADFDLEAADAAVTVLARAGERETLLTTLLPWALRNFADVGHHPIFAAGAFDLLDACGWEHGETVLRSLVQGLLLPGPTATCDDHLASRELAARVVRDGAAAHAPGDAREAVAAAPFELATLGGDPAAARGGLLAGLVRLPAAEQLAAGFAQLADVALELLAENRGLLAVHALTGVTALHQLATRTTDPHAQWTALLQAASWLPRWRTAFGGAKALPRERSPRLAELMDDLAAGAAPASTADTKPLVAPEAWRDLLAGAADDRALAVRRIGSAIVRSPSRETATAALRACTHELLLAKGRESHDWKFLYAWSCWHSLPDHGAGLRGAARLASVVQYLRLPAEPDFAPSAAIAAALAR